MYHRSSNTNYFIYTSHLALINCLWKCKKSKGLMITANSFTKVDLIVQIPSVLDGKIPPAPETNQIAGVVEFLLLTYCEKMLGMLIFFDCPFQSDV